VLKGSPNRLMPMDSAPLQFYIQMCGHS
jgi:hypothetical protein